MPTGFVKIWRESMDHWLWNRRPFDQWHAFEYLIAWAAWEPTQRLFHENLYILNRGQHVTTVSQLARDFGWSRNKVRNWLHLLKTGQMIDQQTDRGSIVVTLCNYGTWQDLPKPKDTKQDTKPDSGGTGEGQEVDSGGTTIEEGKKGRLVEGKEGTPEDPPLEKETPPPKQPQTKVVKKDPPEITSDTVERYLCFERHVTGKPWALERIEAALARSQRKPQDFLDWARSHPCPDSKIDGQTIDSVCSVFAPQNGNIYQKHQDKSAESKEARNARLLKAMGGD